MEESFMGRGGNLLDPSAQEFYPQFALPHPQIYYPYLPPPPPPPPPLPTHYVHLPLAAAADGFSSRSVVLSMVPPHVTEAAVTQAMMAFGGVRAVDASFLILEGVVTVHFYDLRSAQVAVAEIREQHVRQQSRLGQQFYGIQTAENWAAMQQIGGGGVGRGLIEGQAVWAHFSAKGLEVLNQGSLFVTLSDPAAVSSDGVREIFQAFGPVMEVRESPTKPHHKFVEFFDVRDAARALTELDGKDVGGVRLWVEFSRPGGVQSRSFSHHQHHKRPGHQSLPLPPRLARSSSQGSGGRRINQVGGGGERGEGIVRLKRNEARISNVSRNGNGVINSSGKRTKGSSSRSNSYPSSSNPPPPPPPPSSSSKQQQQQQQQQGSKKGWKKNGNNNNSRFEFRESVGDDGGGMMESGSISSSGTGGPSSCRDSRTTVMIKNIPNKYSQKLLLNMLDNHCIHCNEQTVGGGGGGDQEPLSAYDFVYLPIDFNNKCNVGYGFVNLTSPEAAVRLHRAFHMQPWEVFNSRKICQVTYARLQGLDALKEHFKNSRFACDNDEYMPVVFAPPRDGKLQTEPVPIGGRGSSSDTGCIKIRAADLGGGASSTTASTQAPSDQEAGDDDDDSDGDGGSDMTVTGTGSGMMVVVSDQLASFQLAASSASSAIIGV